MHRRTFLRQAGLGVAAVLPTAPSGRAQPRPFRVLLNSNISGPQAFFFLAQDRGYYRAAGLEATFTGGDGAAAIVPRIGAEGFDFGYGDLNALVPLVARNTADTPIAVYVTFNATPLTIAVDASGPVRTARDLEGRIVVGHPVDAALEVFPEFAGATGIDARRVTIRRSEASMRSMVEDMLAGNCAGLRIRQHDRRSGGAGGHRRTHPPPLPRVPASHSRPVRQRLDGVTPAVARPSGRSAGIRAGGQPRTRRHRV
ncbi:MAG: ABC transporter substrate-binding protein [Vicinamibacterales bacterium]